MPNSCKFSLQDKIKMTCESKSTSGCSWSHIWTRAVVVELPSLGLKLARASSVSCGQQRLQAGPRVSDVSYPCPRHHSMWQTAGCNEGEYTSWKQIKFILRWKTKLQLSWKTVESRRLDFFLSVAVLSWVCLWPWVKQVGHV